MQMIVAIIAHAGYMPFKLYLPKIIYLKLLLKKKNRIFGKILFSLIITGLFKQ